MKVSEKLIGKCLTILGFFVLILVAVSSINASIWSDETNSLINITSSYKLIFSNAVYDCHPPLYHLLLKTFVDAAQILGINRIYLSKIFSIIPFFIIYVFVIIKTHKQNKNMLIGTFLFCLCAMPNLMTYAIQIRMYSWALFFVFMTFAYAYEVLTCESKKSIVLFVLFSLLSSFTHYYACVSVAFIYLFIFIYMFFVQRKKFIKFLIAALVIVALFLPWLISIMDTIKNIISGFWIKPVNLISLIGYIWFILFPNIYKYHLSGSLGIIMAATFLVVLCNYLRSKNTRKIDKIYVLMGIGCTAGTILFGVAASLLLGPVYQDRFIYPTLAVLWLVFSICACSIKNDRVRSGIRILILVFCIINVTDVISKEHIYKENLQKFENAMDNIDIEKSVIVTDSYHISCCMSFYFEEENVNVPVYLWNNETDGMWIKGTFYQNLNNLGDINIIEEYVNLKNDVLFLENVGYNSDFIEKCNASSLNVEKLGQYGLEDREFTLYRIEGD